MVRAVIPPELDPRTHQRPKKTRGGLDDPQREGLLTNAAPAGAVSVIIVGPRVC